MQLGETLGQRQAQTGAVVQAIEVALDLVERDQDLLQLVRVDADTRVGRRAGD